MKWQDRDRNMKASKLQVVDEFRSFVRPSWRPILSGFCTELTGITQVRLIFFFRFFFFEDLKGYAPCLGPSRLSTSFS